jgi:predicted AAA+ superfamily ATPase
VVRGGFPEAVTRSVRRRSAFFESYLTILIERDVTELAVIERRGELRRLLSLFAGRAGGLLVQTSLATASGLPRSTLNRYLELLSAVFLVKQVPAWSSNATTRAIGTPKLAFVDSGLACHLLGQDATRLGEPDGAAGPMLESFVLMELARQLTWSTERARLYHYRTKDGVEVDAVIETADGRVIAIEVKAGATVRTEDLAGLRHLADRLGPRFVAGYLLYTGGQTLPFGDRLRALPLDVLWHARL